MLFYYVFWLRKKLVLHSSILCCFYPHPNSITPKLFYLLSPCIPSLLLILSHPSSISLRFLVDCCVFFVIWRPSNAMMNFIFIIFVTYFDAPKQHKKAPPIHSATASSHLKHPPPSTQFFCWLLLLFLDLRPPKAVALPITQFFDGSGFDTQSKPHSSK